MKIVETFPLKELKKANQLVLLGDIVIPPGEIEGFIKNGIMQNSLHITLHRANAGGTDKYIVGLYHWSADTPPVTPLTFETTLSKDNTFAYLSGELCPPFCP